MSQALVVHKEGEVVLADESARFDPNLISPTSLRFSTRLDADLELAYQQFYLRKYVQSMRCCPGFELHFVSLP